MEKYLEGEAFTDDEIEAALHKGTREGSVVPVFVGSATQEHRRPRADQHDRQARPVPGRGRRRTTTDGKEISPDPNGPFVAQVFKATADPFVGRLTYFRVISGTLSGQGHVYNANRKEEERIGNFLADPGQGPGDTCAQGRARATSPPSPS